MRICLIGAGNLATQLGMALTEKGHQLVQVWSRTQKSAEELASKLKCSYVTDISLISSDADIYIIAVVDTAIESVLSKRNWSDILVVHTAGSTPMSILGPYCKNFGVFYPFQTFTINKKVDFDQVPVCIEANSTHNLNVLKELAQSISQNVKLLDSTQRQQIHLAAVFACNFVNHLYKIGEELLYEKGIGFEILKPLILETAAKIVEQSPVASQTGPASRNDKITMDKHLVLLNNHPELKNIYKQFSDRIIQTPKKL
ncbi:MAG TPA: DUF2520 domain-containing protein [Prolixibacteraceae bacterium]|nr:DUF2520 domain-containing protein [Prolixibacteraceae bacterium]